MVGVVLSLLALLACSEASVQSKCAGAAGETTHRGGNQLYAYVEPKAVSSTTGVARYIDGRPFPGALVEIFDHPEWIKEGLDKSNLEQRRIAACKTRRDGRFSFANIQPGTYELRLSKNRAWNVVHVYFTVDSESRNVGQIKVVMHLGS